MHETRNTLADVALDPKSAGTLKESFVLNDFLFGHGVSPMKITSESRFATENGAVTNLERDAALGAVAGECPVTHCFALSERSFMSVVPF